MKKVGFLAFLGTNYGTVLQSFALFHTIKKLGYDCEIIGADEFIKRPIPNPNVLDLHSKEYDKQKTQLNFEKFIIRMFKFNDTLGNIPLNSILTLQQEKEIKKFNAFICGSDQIWLPGKFWFCAKHYLQFAPEEKRIAYAPSLGWNKVEYSAINNIPQWRRWLSGVKYLSTRETSGSAIVEEITGKPVETVLDPTFLLRPSDWNELFPYGVLADEPHKILMNKKPYMVAYLLDTYNVYNEYVRKLASRMDLDIIWLTGRDNVGPVQRNCTNTDPSGFIEIIRNASFVCTDGYHGTCFSLNFSKPFALLTKPVTATNDSRMQDLMNRLGVKNRVVRFGYNPNKFDIEMDYGTICKNIDSERKKSLAYLCSALEGATEGCGQLYEHLKNTTSKVLTLVQPEPKKKVPRRINRVPLDDPNNCTGCGACMNMCPVEAIQMLPNKDGFLEPVVDNIKCVRCGKCLANCPLRKKPELYLREKPSNIYAAWATNPFIISRSASGGMFPLMASWMFTHNGIVYGTAWDTNLNAKTVCANNMEELNPLCGSKYVQGETGFVYQEIKQKLFQKQPVLFSGTSCQVAGLYAYLNGDHEFLVTVDFICSGVPSPQVFKKYIAWREKQLGSKIINVEFRSKRKGWGGWLRFDLESGKSQEVPLYNDEYGMLFGWHWIQRPSCFVCRFRGVEKRWADITIGDFWGIGKHGIQFTQQQSQGVSVVLPNSIKGRTLFQSISADKKNIFVEERPIEECYPGNAWLLKNYIKNPEYEYFNKLLREKPFEEAFSEYFGSKNIRLCLNME